MDNQCGGGRPSPPPPCPLSCSLCLLTVALWGPTISHPHPVPYRTMLCLTGWKLELKTAILSCRILEPLRVERRRKRYVLTFIDLWPFPIIANSGPPIRAPSGGILKNQMQCTIEELFFYWKGYLLHILFCCWFSILFSLLFYCIHSYFHCTLGVMLVGLAAIYPYSRLSWVTNDVEEILIQIRNMFEVGQGSGGLEQPLEARYASTATPFTWNWIFPNDLLLKKFDCWLSWYPNCMFEVTIFLLNLI